MSDITTQYADSINAYQQEVYNQLEALGIDPAGINLFDVDGEYDQDLLSDENLSPYFQLAVLQLASMIDPEKINSDADEVTIDELPDLLGTELYNWLVDAVMENPELMLTSGGLDQNEINAILEIISSANYQTTYGDGTSESTEEGSDDASYSADARELAEEWGVTADAEAYFDAYDTYNASIMAVLEQLNQVSQAKIVLSQAMLDPEAAGTTLEQLDYEMQSNMASEQSLFNQLTFLQDGLTTVTETFSKIFDTLYELSKSITRNYLA